LRIGRTALRSAALKASAEEKKSAMLEDWPDGLEERLATAGLEGKEGEIDRRVMLVLYCLVPFFIRRCS
jgi:hypothetical protein